VDNLAERLDDLQAKLDDRCSELQSAATAVTQFNVSISINIERKVIFMYGRSRFCLTHEVGIFTVFINPFINQIKMFTSTLFPFSRFLNLGIVVFYEMCKRRLSTRV
jgi:hypothetical protein